MKHIPEGGLTARLLWVGSGLGLHTERLPHHGAMLGQAATVGGTIPRGLRDPSVGVSLSVDFQVGLPSVTSSILNHSVSAHSGMLTAHMPGTASTWSQMQGGLSLPAPLRHSGLSLPASSCPPPQLPALPACPSSCACLSLPRPLQRPAAALTTGQPDLGHSWNIKTSTYLGTTCTPFLLKFFFQPKAF